LTNATFSGNSVTVIGGGMANDNSNPVLTNVTFSGNTAEAGGGLFNSVSSPQLTNVTFSSNISTGTNSYDGGGGLYNYTASPTLNNVTFSGNTASGSGGSAMRNYSGSNPSVANSIFWGDATAEVVNSDTSAATIKDSIVAGDCPAGSTCTHVLIGDPKLGPLQNNGGFTKTRALLPGSAAIDKGGVNAACADTDQRGVTRPQGAACDMGAYEAPPGLNVKSTGSQDGWVLESSETSGKGGTLDSTANIFILGDDAADRQYRAIVSFDTSALPNNAVVSAAVLKIKQNGKPTGTNPFSVLGGLLVDIRKPYFGTTGGLQLGDFGAVASAWKVETFGAAPAAGWYSVTLNAAGRSNINKYGITQFRLRFARDDNDNRRADYMKFYSGDARASAYRPLLLIQYTVP
jgi:hypothetical protein